MVIISTLGSANSGTDLPARLSLLCIVFVHNTSRDCRTGRTVLPLRGPKDHPPGDGVTTFLVPT
jgi:hypothetical protein